MRAVKRGRQSNRAIFGPLVLIALASLSGLVIALTGDGARDATAWLGLAVPVAAAAWAAWARPS
ncbi:hypothetical protein KOF26_06415 [Sphingomonas sp. XMGL2]|uniref:Uncharacterized protein n=1 Tax=Sphingomonas quercus TaxID=2842451 RepID=A0ABS6BIR3_9SPHN|nr:hypothetical protein [Sphingomonas quercus]